MKHDAVCLGFDFHLLLCFCGNIKESKRYKKPTVNDPSVTVIKGPSPIFEAGGTGMKAGGKRVPLWLQGHLRDYLRGPSPFPPPSPGDETEGAHAPPPAPHRPGAAPQRWATGGGGGGQRGAGRGARPERGPGAWGSGTGAWICSAREAALPSSRPAHPGAGAARF